MLLNSEAVIRMYFICINCIADLTALFCGGAADGSSRRPEASMKMRHASGLVVGILMFALCGIAEAHKDRLIVIDERGKIHGLPSRFQPALIKVLFSDKYTNTPPISRVDFQVGKNQTTIPSCATGLLGARNMEQISGAGSWHHGALHAIRSAPSWAVPAYKTPKASGFTSPYLWLRFPSIKADRNGGNSPEFLLLFDLDSSRLIKMEEMVASEDGKTTRYHVVDLGGRCTDAELKAFMAHHVDRKP